jgi:hypothetical protein
LFKGTTHHPFRSALVPSLISAAMAGEEECSTHSWPLSHALMEALYVITSGSSLPCDTCRRSTSASPHCWPFLTCTDGGAVCDHIWLESALPHLPKKPECRCPLAGLSCRGRWPGPSAATKAMLLATSGWHRCAGLTCTDVVFMYALLRVIGQLFEQLPHVWDICARYEWEWGGQLLG